MAMEFNARKHSETDSKGVGLHRFDCSVNLI